MEADEIITIDKDLPSVFDGLGKASTVCVCRAHTISSLPLNFTSLLFHVPLFISVQLTLLAFYTLDFIQNKKDIAGKIEREPEEGNIEYKLKLAPPTEERLQQLTTQMAWRIEEGGTGSPHYHIVTKTR